MDFNAWIGLFGFLFMLLLIFLGVPIFISMLVASFFGSLLIAGKVYTFQQFASAPYNITSSYTFAVVPLFVLMSSLAANSGIAEAAYRAAQKWFSKFKGGPLLVIIAAQALFGASCGSSLASAAVFTKMVLPDLKKSQYDPSLSMACLATAGSLASLIPPSIGVVIICILTENSIGKALMATVIPGILFAFLLMATVRIISIIKPEAFPSVPIEISWRERISSLLNILPILVVIGFIILGMYFGVFPPTIGGAIGSAVVLVIALFKGMNLKLIGKSFYESVLLNSQLFPLLIGGFIFARFMALSGLPKMLLNMVVQAHLSPYIVMFIVVLFYLFIGCVLEFMSMAVVTLPIVYPLLIGLGFDPISTVVILVFLSEVALITPPIGMSVFVVSEIGGVKPEFVFRNVFPFFLTCLVLLVILIFFPKLSLWLPGLFYKQI